MGSPIWRGSQLLQEQKNSPDWTFGERIILTRTFRGPHALCLSNAPMRGALGSGIASGMRVAESRVVRDVGASGILTINYETNGQPTQGAQLPPDEESLEWETTERSMRKHPKYAGLNESAHAAITIALESTDEAKRTAALRDIQLFPLVDSLYTKLQRDQTHYRISVPTYRRVAFGWLPFTQTSKGDFLQQPITGNLDVPAGLEWMRMPDRQHYNGTHYQLQMEWQGVPSWDHDIYPNA